MLKYFHSSTKETANNSSSDLVKRLDQELEPIRNSPKFGGDFISIQEKIYTIGLEREKIGREEGRQEGKDEERSKVEKNLREMGLSESQIKRALAD